MMDTRKSFLLIEDDQVLVRDLLSWVIEIGHAISGICFNGEDAIVQLKSNTPDFVIIDIDLADGTGYELAERIKEVKLPFIVITKSTDEVLHRKIMKMKANGLMIKPVHREKFIRVHKNSFCNCN